MTDMHPNPEDLARLLKVLAVGTRVRIVQLLRQRGALCVNALAARLDVTQGAVSQHLRVMRDAHLLIDERRGYFVHYRLNEETMARWLEQIVSLLSPRQAPEDGTTPTQGEDPCAAARKNRCVRSPRT